MLTYTVAQIQSLTATLRVAVSYSLVNVMRSVTTSAFSSNIISFIFPILAFPRRGKGQVLPPREELEGGSPNISLDYALGFLSC